MPVQRGDARQTARPPATVARVHHNGMAGPCPVSNELLKGGIVVNDTPEGQKWVRK